MKKMLLHAVLAQASESVRRLNPGGSPRPAPVRAKAQPDICLGASTDEDRLNKTERAWLAELRALGYREIGIQNITFKLGHDCRYTPDFTAISPLGHRVAFEVKGFMRDDARVKLMVAARQWRWLFRFILVTREKGLERDEWQTEIVTP